MAYQQVFGTTELLEGILFFLPLPDLLRVQAVSSHWQQTIQRSSQLQERLFLKAVKRDDTVWLARVTNLPSGMGPLPRRYPADVRIEASVTANSKELQHHQGLLVKPVRINPLCLHRLIGSPDLQTAPEFILDKNANNGTPLFLNKDIDLLKRPTDKINESWQDMLLTQPPVQHLTVEVGVLQELNTMSLMAQRHRLRRWRSPVTTSKKLVNEGGVRMRDVVSAMRDLREGMAVTPDPSNDTEPHAIYMHGAISVDEADEEIVERRTKRWLEGNSVADDWSLI